MTQLIATAESIEQAHQLLEVGVDGLYVGEDEFGLRLPASFSLEDLATIVSSAHQHHKKVIVAVNALMHNDHIDNIRPYLQSLQDLQVDAITVGDPGVIHVMQKHSISLPFWYDAQTMVTSSRQVNFWAKRGAIGAVLARELTKDELLAIQQDSTVPVEVLVYGATCIHQSKRPLVNNYFNYIGENVPSTVERPLFLSEPKKENTHYSIYEDCNGTHIFASNDVNLMTQLDVLWNASLRYWKLDGIFTRGQAFVDIATCFVEARQALLEKRWTEEYKQQLNERLHQLHPQERSLDEGFFLKNAEDIQ